MGNDLAAAGGGDGGGDADGAAAGGGGGRGDQAPALTARLMLTRPRAFFVAARTRWRRFTTEREDLSLWIFKPDDK